MPDGGRIANFNQAKKRISFDGKQFCLRLPNKLVGLLQEAGYWGRTAEMRGIFSLERDTCFVMLVFRRNPGTSVFLGLAKKEAGKRHAAPDADYVYLSDLLGSQEG